MLCQFWFYVFCTVCWCIWNRSPPAAETITGTHSPAHVPEDKVKENAQYQLQTSTAIRKGHPGVCLRAPIRDTVCICHLCSAGRPSTLSPLCLSVYLCHFGQVCFSEASATICFSFPGGWFPRLPPARYSLSLPSLLRRTLPAAVYFPFVLLKLQNTNADCKIYWSKMGRDSREGRENTVAMAESGLF